MKHALTREECSRGGRTRMAKLGPNGRKELASRGFWAALEAVSARQVEDGTYSQSNVNPMRNFLRWCKGR